MKRMVALFFISIFAALPIANAQPEDPSSLFQWSVSTDSSAYSPGDEVTLSVTFVPEPEHFIYESMTSVTPEVPETLTPVSSSIPDPIEKMDPFENVLRNVYESEQTFSFTYQIADTASGLIDVPIEIRFQGCSPEICYFPETRSLLAQIRLESQAAISEAPQPDEENPFVWSVSLSQNDVAQGSSTFAEIRVHIADEHYIYRDMTSFSLGETAEAQAAEAMYAESIAYMDPFQQTEKQIYRDRAIFRLPITMLPDAAPGEQEIPVVIQYQGCSPEVCFFPETLTIPVQVTVLESNSPGEAIALTSASSGASPSDSLVEGWLSQGLLITFVFAYLFGLATCATPCVYPLIPITITIFGARDTKNVFHAFTLAATYVAGIALMYSLLGFSAAYTGAIFGSIMSNPWIIGTIAMVFIVLGLSMLGLFEIQVPGSLQARLSQVGGKGYTSAYMMGTVAGVIAAPCTGPVLAGILAYVASQGNPAFGFTLLLIYALGLGTPFLVLGTFSGMVNKIPRSGAWMESVKSVFGIVLFVAALYYLKDVIPLLKEPLVHSVWMYSVSAVLLVAGIAMGAIHLSYHTPALATRIRKTTGIVASVTALYLAVGSMTAVTASEVVWEHDLQAGLSRAQETQQPVMIDFSADWCSVCHEIEATTFSDPIVGEALREYVTIKVDLTRIDETTEALKDEYGITGLPFITFINSSGERLTGKTIRGYIGSEEFLQTIADIQ